MKTVIYRIGYNSKEHKYRKPNGNWLKEYSELDLENSVMVGDATGLEREFINNKLAAVQVKKDFSDSDLQFAKNAGIGTYYDV